MGSPRTKPASLPSSGGNKKRRQRKKAEKALGESETVFVLPLAQRDLLTFNLIWAAHMRAAWEECHAPTEGLWALGSFAARAERTTGGGNADGATARQLGRRAVARRRRQSASIKRRPRRGPSGGRRRTRILRRLS